MRSYLKSNIILSWISVREFFSALFSSSFAILLVACIFIIWEMTAPGFYQTYFTKFELTNPFCLFFYLIYTLCCFGIFPLVYSGLFLKENLSELGLRKPAINLNGMLLFIIGLPICLACLIWLCKQPSFRNYYTFAQHITFLKFFVAQVVVIPLYYLAEEFFFRGFLFVTLWKRIRWKALWITEFLFTISHLGKPGLEILFSIPVGVILNFLTLWTRSIIPAVVFHAILGLTLNFIFYYNLV